MTFHHITAEWLTAQMALHSLERQTLITELNLNAGDLSSYTNGSKEIPATRRAQLHWYFEAKRLQAIATDLEELRHDLVFQDYEKLREALWDAETRLQNIRDFGPETCTVSNPMNILPDAPAVDHLTAEESELENIYHQIYVLLDRCEPFGDKYRGQTHEF